MEYKIRLMAEHDKNEILKMMKVFYESEAVLSNGSKEIFLNDFDNLLEEQKKGDTPIEAALLTVETTVDTLELSAEAQAVLEARQAAEDKNEPNKKEEEEK